MDSDIYYETVTRPPDWNDIREFYDYQKGTPLVDDEAEFYFEQGADAMYNTIERAIRRGELAPNTITNVLNDYGLNIWIVKKKISK